MKAHIGVEADTRLIHSVATTSAKVHDSQVIGALLHSASKTTCFPACDRAGISPRSKSVIDQTFPRNDK